MLIGASACGNICRTVKQVLRRHFAKLTTSTETCVQTIANEMYSKGLINREVRNLPTFAKIEIDFSTLLSLCAEDIKKTEQLCWLFLDCLATVKGPAKEEAIALAKDWECEVFKSHQISLSLTKTTLEVKPKEVQLSSKDQLAIELENLQKRCPSLIADITTHYANSGKHDTLHIARWAQNFLKETGLAHDGVTIDEIFERMNPHYSFFDIDPIKYLIEAYPIDDTDLKSRFDQYAKDLDSFIESAELNDVMKAINTAINDESTKVDPKVILKLSGKWSERTIGNLRKLTEYLFGEEAKYLTIKKFLSGSIQIQFLVSSYKIVPALIDRAEACVHFMHHFGIFQLIINYQTIIDEDENVNFCFEESLLYTIENINNIDDIEYESMFFLFFQLAVDLSYQNKQGNTALMLASEGGHYNVVELLLLLNKDLNINIQDNNGVTALMFASQSGHHQVVELLLSKDPNINIQNNNGVTALMLASQNGHHQVIELLLSKDPDVNIRDNDGVTALMLANQSGHHQVVELLLSKNPDINIRDNDGVIALMFACDIGHHQVVELFLSKDPNINIQNNNGVTALMLTSQNGHHQVAELLLNKDPDINIQNNNGVTALMFASQNGHHQVVELLLRKDPNINIQNNNGVTALMFGSQNGHHQVVELLLSKDPDINIQKNDGWTALMFASQNGHHQVVELLLSKDPDIKIQNNDGWTALMIASDSGHHQVVELLLSKDPGINVQNNNGWTALMIACDNGHHQVVELLLSKDPDIKIQNNDGWTALMIASDSGHHQVVELLLSKDPGINVQNNNGWTALMIACDNGHHQVVELLLSKDPDINIQDNDGWTALMFASSNGLYQVVKLLLSKANPSDINIQDNDGRTALMLASHNGHHQVVELLLSEYQDIMQRKCDLSIENIMSAFSIACYEGHSSVMIRLSKELTNLSFDERKLLEAAAEGDIGKFIMLFEVGVSSDTPLVGGITPLMIAASCGHIDIVDTLIQTGADVNKTNDEGKTALDILLGMKEEGTSMTSSAHIIDLLMTNGACTTAQANPTQLLFKEIFSPSSNIGLIRSLSETSTETVQRPPQISELSENELAQYTQQH